MSHRPKLKPVTEIHLLQQRDRKPSTGLSSNHFFAADFHNASHHKKGRSMNIMNLSLISGLAWTNLIAYAESSSGRVSSNASVSTERSHQLIVDQASDSTTGDCQKPGLCNLRAAIMESQNLGGDVTLFLSVDPVMDQGEIMISSLPNQSPLHLRIIGQNGVRNILGSGTSRLFQIQAFSELDLEHLLINKFVASDGGAILNHGVMSTRAVEFRDNQSLCFGSGAMTSYASCSGGAIFNTGSLALGNGTVFESNEARATASTASFTFANAHGGAISSTGMVVLDGTVGFGYNSVTSTAASGIHPMPSGGADAAASGGAIANFRGSLLVTRDGRNKCSFVQNDATANASSPYGVATPSSVGGAISSSGGRAEELDSVCVFEGNFALTGPDAHIVP